MPHDPALVDTAHADLFHHGRPAEDGSARPLTDEQWDAQRHQMLLDGTWPFPPKE